MKTINGMKMYNTADLAKMLKLSERTIRTYKKDGRLKWVQVGHERLTSKKNLDAFLNGIPLEKQLARAEVARILANLK